MIFEMWGWKIKTDTPNTGDQNTPHGWTTL